jgi:CubicO group peptidase (beta-lactamase class C family)
MTALTVMGLVTDGVLELSTLARDVLGDDLPLVDDGVTVEHLLAHRSGIGDYLDEEGDEPVTAYVLPVPVHRLATTEDYLAVLDGHPQKFPPGERFAYCNSGYVVLALIAERVAGTPFPDLLAERVCGPAGMRDTAFPRTDEPDGGVALGYLGDGPRTNVLHLPVRGSGDAGAWSSAADLRRFWTALFGQRLLPRHRVDDLVRPRSREPVTGLRYGLGFWRHPTGPQVVLQGRGPGLSFRSVHDPTSGVTATVLANTTGGAWPVARRLDDLVR